MDSSDLWRVILLWKFIHRSTSRIFKDTYLTNENLRSFLWCSPRHTTVCHNNIDLCHKEQQLTLHGCPQRNSRHVNIGDDFMSFKDEVQWYILCSICIPCQGIHNTKLVYSSCFFFFAPDYISGSKTPSPPTFNTYMPQQNGCHITMV